MSGQNAFDKTKVIAACEAAIKTILDTQSKSKREDARFLHGAQLTAVEKILTSAKNCENAVVNLDTDEFWFIHSWYKKD